MPTIGDDRWVLVERGAGEDRIRLGGKRGQDQGALFGFHGGIGDIVSLVVRLAAALARRAGGRTAESNSRRAKASTVHIDGDSAGGRRA